VSQKVSTHCTYLFALPCGCRAARSLGGWASLPWQGIACKRGTNANVTTTVRVNLLLLRGGVLEGVRTLPTELWDAAAPTFGWTWNPNNNTFTVGRTPSLTPLPRLGICTGRSWSQRHGQSHHQQLWPRKAGLGVEDFDDGREAVCPLCRAVPPLNAAHVM